MIILCITGFVVAGFEHCVANMAPLLPLHFWSQAAFL